MADTVPKEGIATTVTFGTSTFTDTLLLRSVSWTGAYGRETLDTSHMGTTAARTFIGEQLYNAGEIELTYLYGAGISFSSINTQAAAAATAQDTVTIGFGGGTAKVVKGILTGVSFGAAIGELMEFTMTLKASGAIS